MTTHPVPEIPEDLHEDWVSACAERDNEDRPELWRRAMREVVTYIERIAKAEAENATLKAQIEALGRPVTDERKRIWFEDFRPTIDAIGEISVQEAMDAIERSL